MPEYQTPEDRVAKATERIARAVEKDNDEVMQILTAIREASLRQATAVESQSVAAIEASKSAVEANLAAKARSEAERTLVLEEIDRRRRYDAASS